MGQTVRAHPALRNIFKNIFPQHHHTTTTNNPLESFPGAGKNRAGREDRDIWT